MSTKSPRQPRAHRVLWLTLASAIALMAVLTPGLFRQNGDTSVAAADPTSSTSTSTSTVVPSPGSSDRFTPYDEAAFRLRWANDQTFRMTVAYLNGTPEERAALDRYLVPAPPAPAPAPAAAAAAPQAASAPAPAVSGGSAWDRLAQCESSGNWAIHSGNGFSGGLQFVNSTWTGFGGGAFAPQAWQASREQQIVVAERVLASSGWGAWPACSAKLGLR